MRWAVLLPRSRLDLSIATVGLALCLMATWVPSTVISTAVAGPVWLRFIYPLALALPLAWRRTAPLAAQAVVMGGVTLQAIVTGDSPEGLHLMYTAGIATFAVAAYSTPRRATVGLLLGACGYAAYAAANQDIRTGRPSETWAGSFFAVALLSVWLVGVFVRNRREGKAAEVRARELETRAAQAVSDERARLARELHDVVSHNLSVVVLQAAGARAAGNVDPAVLERIESSGRESLVEMRRLLGVLRSDGEEPALEPRPGIAGLPALIDHVRAAGVGVELTICGERADLPPALDLSVYRLVQESLTNVLKHAGGASASVRIRCASEAVTVDVVDEGPTMAESPAFGHGLIGMRERVRLFGGDLMAGPRPSGGFTVHARLPLEAPR